MARAAGLPVLLAATVAAAGEPAPEAAAPDEPAVTVAEPDPRLGGFGHLSPGVLVGSFGALDDALSADDALGSGAELGPVAVTLGGGGGMLLGGRYVVRGKGFGMVVPSTTTVRGRASLTGGGGGFDVGLVYHHRQWLLYPFFGVGGMGMALDVDNQSAGDLVLGGRTIAAGQRRTLTSGFATAELGFGFVRRMFGAPPPGARGGMGGLVHGGELGLVVSLWGSGWDDAQGRADLPQAQVVGAYLRLTVGGGGFSSWGDPRDRGHRTRHRARAPMRRAAHAPARSPSVGPRAG